MLTFKEAEELVSEKYREMKGMEFINEKRGSFTAVYGWREDIYLLYSIDQDDELFEPLEFNEDGGITIGNTPTETDHRTTFRINMETEEIEVVEDY